MPEISKSKPVFGSQMQLSILSAEILKTKLGAKSNISVSCNISELPNYHCNLVFVESQQDLGPIGFLRFDNRRPLASAMINLKENDFYDLSSLIKTVPPRSATIFLYTEKYNEDAIIGRTMSGEASKVGIRDLSWRYPII